MSQVHNIRISGPVSFTNKENQNRITHEPIFAPDPMLSSTRLNESLEENDHILVDHNATTPPPPAIHISINSSCESGSTTRKVTVDRSSSKASMPKVTITNNKPSQHNNSQNSRTSSKNVADNVTNTSNTNSTVVRRASKRKASAHGGDTAPPKKKNASDVIVLDDTTLDVDHVDDDSVVFVSETLVSPSQHQLLARSSKKKAANFISINGTSSKPQTVSYILHHLTRGQNPEKSVFVNFMN